MTQKWIKIAGPGDFRGEGEWRKIEDVNCSPEDWDINLKTSFLPVAEQDDKPTT